MDYSNISTADGESYDKQLKVWMQTGRDQAEILRRLIDNEFSKKYETNVTLEVVVADTILKSVLAGLGPDVVLNSPSTEPINYAIRNAAVDLAKMPGFEETASAFFQAALEPYRFGNSVYALPETFTFPMFFYRTDIFAELGLEVPENWDELLLLIPELQGKGLSMAFPAGTTNTAARL